MCVPSSRPHGNGRARRACEIAAGSLVVILVWIYYSAQIVLSGAELTKVYADRAGSRVEPARGVVRITPTDRARQGMPKSA